LEVRNHASYCSKLSQLHQHLLMLFFIQLLYGNCYKRTSIVTFTHSYKILITVLSSLLNGAMLTSSVTRNFQNLRYFRCPVWKKKS